MDNTSKLWPVIEAEGLNCISFNGKETFVSKYTFEACIVNSVWVTVSDLQINFVLQQIIRGMAFVVFFFFLNVI